MVKLKLPLVENSETVEIGVNQTCDPSQSIYSKRYCIKDYLFCSEDNPCPSGLPCIDRVCQCLPNSDSYVTLTPPPVRMYTIGCNFDMKRDFFDGCRDYEYSVTGVCLLNYCSEEVPCYGGVCDQQRNVCVGLSSTQKPLPQGRNRNITLGNDPYKFRRDGLSPVLIIIMAAGVVAAIAMMGCMMRMLTLSFKSSFKWASRGQLPVHHKDTEGGDEDVSNGEKLSVSCVGGESTTTLSADIINPAKFTESSQSPPSTVIGITLSQGCTQAPPVVLSSKDPSSVSSMPSPHISPYAHPNPSLVSNRSLSDPFRHGVRIQGGPSTISLAQTMGSVATAAEPASQSTDTATIPTAEGGHDLQQQGPYPLAIHLSPNHGNPGMTYPYNQHSFGSSQPTSPGTSAPTSPLDPPPDFFGGAVGANENPSMAYPPPHNHHPGTPLMFGPSSAQNAMASGEVSKPARRNLPVGFASSPVADSIERFAS